MEEEVVMEGEGEYSLLEWTVVNFGCWNEHFHDRMISSPKLQMDSIFSCTFELYPLGLTGSGEYMELRVCYTAGSIHPTTGDITYVGSDGRILCAQQVEDFESGDGVLLSPPGPKFLKVVAEIRKNLPWYKDRLTLRLRFRNASPTVHRTSTKIKAIDTTFRIRRFKSLKRPVYVADVPQFLTDEGTTVDMVLEAVNKDLSLDSCVDLKFRSPRTNPETFLKNFLVYTRLSVLDSDDVVLKSEDNEHLFVKERSWTFSKSLTARELTSCSHLLLRVKIVPSRIYKHGIVSEFDPKRAVVVPTFRTENRFTISEQNGNSVNVLSGKLSCLYQDPEFSDFQLKCEDVTFPVHRNILSARSPVFRTMFLQREMSSMMDIEDLDAPTLKLLLAFLYSGAVKDLHSESAKKLYVAAEKYLVPSLKRECANFLSANFPSSNVCDVLSFAHRHKDDQMTSACLDFILKTYNAVVTSKEWDVFMEREPELAASVVTLMTERRGIGPYNFK